MSSLSVNSAEYRHEPLAVAVRCEHQSLIVDLSDGRNTSVPLISFPRLFDASAEQRAAYKLIGRGQGIHWEQIDEDLSVAGLLRGPTKLLLTVLVRRLNDNTRQ